MASRDASLPAGMSDLGELVKQQQQTDQTLQRMDSHLLVIGRSLARTVFDMLYSRIDHDLLFTTEADLVMPEIRKASHEVVQGLAGNTPIPSDDTTSAKMIDILAREAWRYICQHRPKSD